MTGRRQQREARVQLGEALATVGLIVLVVTPIVYRVRTSSPRVEAKGSILWPTAWMWVPLLLVLIGLALWLWNSNLWRFRASATRRSDRRERPGPA